MSNPSSIEANVSKIEKKVQKNTFFANSNCLESKDLGNSQNSLFSKISRQPSSIHGTKGHSLLSHLSFFETPLIKPSLQEINLSSIQHSLTHYNLQDILNDLSPDGILTLPGNELSVSSLDIFKSATIKGSFGSILRVSSGINIIESCNHSNIAIIELSLIFNSSQKGALFSIEASEAQLELSDCLISSEPLQSSVDTCCFIISPSTEESSSAARLTLNSCSISGFMTIIKSCENSEISISKSHLCESLGSCIMAFKPKLLTITDSMISKNKKHGIEVTLPNDSSQSSTRTKHSSAQTTLSSISLHNSDIINNNGCGLKIFSESPCDFNLSLIISSNKFSRNTKEGIALIHISIYSLEIIGNDFSHNTQSGLWFQKLSRLTANSTFTISSNRFSDSFLGYGIYSYSSCCPLNNNEIYRNSLGGIYISGNCHSSAFDNHQALEISNCLFQANGENGVEISDYSNNISIKNCTISDNSKNGMMILSGDANVGKQHVECRNCEISGNGEVGVVIVRVRCVFSKVAIMRNGKDGKAELEYGENSKELVKFVGEGEAETDISFRGEGARRNLKMILPACCGKKKGSLGSNKNR